MSGNLNLPAKATGVLCLTLGGIILAIVFESFFTNYMFRYIDKQKITLDFCKILLLIALLAASICLVHIGAHEFTTST